MKDFLNRISTRALMAFGAMALMIVATTVPPSHAQQFRLFPGTIVEGMLQMAGRPPVGTGCTVASGSADMMGQCVATATSGTLVFSAPLVTAPFCQLVDASATPIAVYAVTNLQITLTTMTVGHIYTWQCAARPGG